MNDPVRPRVLVDTNVLLRLAQPTSPQHAPAQAALMALDSAGLELCLVPQVLYEYWAVATRPPSANGLGLSVPEADAAGGAAAHRLFTAAG